MKFDWKKIKKPILGLSPMADMTDGAYSKIVRGVVNEKIANSGLVIFREMISAEAIVRENEKTEEMAVIDDVERPVIQQIFGADPKVMTEAAKIIERKFKPDGIDINMGCPVYKMTSNFNGAALMKDPKLAAEIVSAVKNAVSIPVSVKIRAGWSDPTECIEFAKIIENAGADLISVHGRTQKQVYTGKTNREVVARVKETVSIPVLYNGDIFSWQDYFEALKETKCDGALIARGALGNPWIFSQIEQMSTNIKPDKIILPDRVVIVLKHLDLHLKQYGENKVSTFRKHLSWYFKGITNFKKYKQQIMTTNNRDELEKILKEIAI